MSPQPDISLLSSPSSSRCIISCHCGASRQTIELKLQHNSSESGHNDDSASPAPGDETGTQKRSDPKMEITLCHCYTCRHTTGQMFASWAQIRAPQVADKVDKILQKYLVVRRYAVRSPAQQGENEGKKEDNEHEREKQEGREHEGSTEYYFCGTCGCHLFRGVSTGSEEEGQPRGDHRQNIEKEKNGYKWEVATGVIVEDSLVPVGSPRKDAQQSGLHTQHELTGIKWRHEKVGQTKDGGLSVWLDYGKDGSTAGGLQDTEKKTDSAYSPSHEIHRAHMQESFLRQNDEGEKEDSLLKATCHCSNVSFSIIRPSSNPAFSTSPRSNFPDLMYAYISTPMSVISNPDDVKWWLQTPAKLSTEENSQEGTSSTTKIVPPETKYLAGTCACRSCRLTSGFEIQSWAFIPRGNILMDLPSPLQGSAVPLPPGQERRAGGGRPTVPLEFPSQPHEQQKELGSGGTSNNKNEEDKQVVWPLKSYESSPGVVREFCPVCGATVFWHDKWRPDLIDVSVGLLRFPGDDEDLNSGSGLGERGGHHSVSSWIGGAGAGAGADGARHESWLEWWRDRVSFAEDAGLDRVGGCSIWGRELVGELERGLRSNVGGESISEE